MTYTSHLMFRVSERPERKNHDWKIDEIKAVCQKPDWYKWRDWLEHIGMLGKVSRSSAKNVFQRFKNQFREIEKEALYDRHDWKVCEVSRLIELKRSTNPRYTTRMIAIEMCIPFHSVRNKLQELRKKKI